MVNIYEIVWEIILNMNIGSVTCGREWGEGLDLLNNELGDDAVREL